MRKIVSYLPALAIAAMISLNSFSQKEKLPPPPPPPPKPLITASMKPAAPVTIDKFYKKNPSVANVYSEKDRKIIIDLKDGTKEKYNMCEDREKKDFINKYDALPLLPPPPP